MHHGKYINDSFPRTPEIFRSSPMIRKNRFPLISTLSSEQSISFGNKMLSFQLRKAFSFGNINMLKCCFMSTQQSIKVKPQSSKFGILKASIIITPCLYFGGMLSKNLASFLEEWNIFVPDDDDDDDWRFLGTRFMFIFLKVRLYRKQYRKWG